MNRIVKKRSAAAFLLLLAILAFFHLETSRIPQPIRTQPPETGKAGSQFYYDSRINPFFPDFAPYAECEGGYVTGNCTWYAWGRACEMAGRKLPHPLSGNASSWWEQNQQEGWYSYGTKPRRGAIVCWKTHVAVVEREQPLIVSESGWQVEKKKGDIFFHCGKPWREESEIIGYIYTGK